MPLITIERLHEDACWGIWKIDETIEALLKSTYLSSSEKTEFEKYFNEKRKKEWLGARSILNKLINRLGYPYSGLEKIDSKKPQLVNLPVYISLAHCYPFALAMVHKSNSCGIDIEKIKPSLLKIRSRFLSDVELSYLNKELDGLCIAWTAKESLYKMYGKIGVSFKMDMFLHPFEVGREGEINAYILIDRQKKEHKLYYRRIEDYYICFGYS
jgi:phosphopantetheinyl transferase